jgi:hypothetical protein
MEKTTQFPNFGRLSIITAVIILAYGLVPFVQIPSQPILIRLPWVVFNFDLEFGTIVSLLVAVLAILGSDWLIQNHPRKENQSFIQHGLVPGLTAWLIGVSLSFLEVGFEWWVVVGLGGILLSLIFIAEYMVVDIDAEAQLPASYGLTIVSFALFLVLAIALQASGLRLFLLLPALVITVFLLVSRTFYLRTFGDWSFFWSLGIALLVGQITIGLHYLPIQPLTFGLLLLAIAYPITALVVGFNEKKNDKSIFIEPAVLFIFLILMAFITNG